MHRYYNWSTYALFVHGYDRVKLTEVSVSDKLEEFRSKQEVNAALHAYETMRVITHDMLSLCALLCLILYANSMIIFTDFLYNNCFVISYFFRFCVELYV